MCLRYFREEVLIAQYKFLPCAIDLYAYPNPLIVEIRLQIEPGRPESKSNLHRFSASTCPASLRDLCSHPVENRFEWSPHNRCSVLHHKTSQRVEILREEYDVLDVGG